MSLPKDKSIRVVGAGMSGLLSAYYLTELGYTVEVYEQDVRVGGKISTATSPFGLRELAANALIADPEVEFVAESIGITLVGKNKNAKKRWILKNGKLSTWPLSFSASLRVFIFMLSYLLKLKHIHPKPNEKLKIWGDRVLGAEATTYLLNPACQGIFGLDSEHLSARLVYNYFFARPKRNRGSHKSKYKGSIAPLNGMGEFPKKLRAYLETKGVPFFLSQKMDDTEGEVIVLCTEWNSASLFLNNSGDSRGELLSRVPGVDLISVNVFFNKMANHQSEGFGCLFPRQEGIEPLGVLINSSIFPKRTVMDSADIVSETWIFGAPHSSQLAPPSKDKLVKALLEARQKIWGFKDEPLDTYVNPWTPALPLYGLELEEVLAKMPVYQNGIYLMGNYLGELGLTRLFHRAKEMAQSL